MQTTSTLIIGAGLTGLSCAHHLRGDYLLVEKENEPGGIVRTRVRHGGFLCDGTGHWLHLRNADMKAWVNQLLAGQLAEYERKAVIHLRGAFTPYPFQANTYGLPREVVMECLLGLLKARHPADFGLAAPGAPPRNFRECVERLFGEGICKYFMVPYNEKLMGMNLEEISASYADRFIPQPSLEDVVKGALGFSRESLGYNARFLYPRDGGISALPRALAASLKTPPRFNTRVTRVDLKDRTATLAGGETVRFQRLVNTMALPRFIATLAHVPEEIRAATSKLRATTVHYFDVGVRGPGDLASRHHWIYFPEPEFIFYRVGSYSAVHADAAPSGCRSYYVEMSGLRRAEAGEEGTGQVSGTGGNGPAKAGGVADWLKRPEELKQRVLADLKRARVLSEHDEILFMELCDIPYAYVVFDENYEHCRGLILDWLAQQGVTSGGRWGGWNYGGMEDAMLEGKAAAEKI